MKSIFMFDKPDTELVKNYVTKFDTDNDRSDYYKDETIKNLFAAMPNNTVLEEVLAKVTLLNSFYSTQIKNKDLINVAKDIIDLKIDSKIQGETVDVDVVNQIAYTHKDYPNSLYSFASKYCSFHNPEKFPIADSYSKGMLYYMNNCDNDNLHFFPHKFSQKDLNNYLNYIKVYNEFIKHFKLGKMTYKEIDKYLWKYAKDRMGERIKITDTVVELNKVIKNVS